jgi:5-(carboxyamino)imidazole ribonucleotide synthase
MSEATVMGLEVRGAVALVTGGGAGIGAALAGELVARGAAVVVIADLDGVAASHVAERLEYCGVLAVEFFLTSGGDLLVNEIAPRPHNSGHYTLDAVSVSQFEQQVRAVCGLALAPAELTAPVAMLNLLGELWPEGRSMPDFSHLLGHGRARLHLYGKPVPRPGRKMGHVNVLGAPGEGEASQPVRLAETLWSALRSQAGLEGS